MAGTGYVLTAVDYEPTSAGDGSLWEGECVFTNWTPSVQVIIPGTFFVTAKVDDYLVYTVKCNDPNAWAAIRAEAGDWSGAIGDADHVVTSTDYTDILVPIDADLLANIQSKGIVMVGENVTLSKVAIQTGGQGTAEYGVLWEGNLAFNNWDPSDDVCIEAKRFEGIVTGDRLIITAHKIAGTTWAGIRPEGGTTWAALPGQNDYYNLSDGTQDQTIEITLSGESVKGLTELGLRFSGDNAVITKVELASGYEEPDGSVLWKGNVTYVNWAVSGECSVAAGKFSKTQVGDKIVVTCKKLTDGVWAGIRAEGADWCGALAGQDYLQLQDGDAQQISITITEALLADLQAHGLRFSADNTCITLIQLVSGSDVPADDALWTGSVDYVSWSPSAELSVDGSAFTNAKAGDKIVVTCKKLTDGTWAGIRPEGKDWCGVLTIENYFELQDGGEQQIEIVIDEALLAALKTHGLRFSGDNVNISKIELISGEDTPVTDALWEGTLTFASWTPSGDVCIAAGKFADAQVGNVIAVTVQKTDAETWGAIRLEGGDTWQALAGQDYVEAQGGDVQQLYFTITTELLADLQAHGLRFSGDNITITKVELLDGVDGISATATTNGQQTVAYDLQGRRAAARGLYILNGHKHIVK